MVWEKAQPKPQLRGGHVILRVKSASINPVDYKAPKAILGPIVGIDVAGVVEEAAAGSPWQPGDEVFGGGSGSLAQFTLSKADNIARKPPSLSWEAAAGYPVAYMTGLQALRDHAKMVQGDRVLVIGASGGTGIAGLQLAKHLGASEVVAICGTSNMELCKQFGADRVVDYRTELSGKTLQDVFGKGAFDVVYDCATASGAGEDYKSQGLAVMKKGRRMVGINGGFFDWLKCMVGWKGSKHMIFLTSFNRKDLDFLANSGIEPLFAEGFKGAPLVEESVVKGFELLKSRRTRGKIVFSVPE